MNSFTSISIPTRFEYPLDAWQYGDEEATKLAILMPGFLDSKDYPHLPKLAQALDKEGYLAIGFDVLGIWKSKAPIELYSMSNWLEEVEDVIHFAKEKYSHIKKVIVAGHSMGGAISLLYPTRHSEISAAISIMGGPPFVRVKTLEERMVKWKASKVKVSERDDPDGSKNVVRIEVPFTFVEDSLQYDIRKVADQVKCPVIIIAGGKDKLIDLGELKEIQASFKAGQAELKVFPQMDHDYRRTPEFIDEVNAAVVDFLKRKV
jgi:pimeloyl-ACP methyl ester carboxylesterase